MKQVKRLLALTLALMMAVALAIPAFAADGGDEGIEPYGQWVICPRCGGDASMQKIVSTQKVSVTNCPNHSYSHTHTLTTTYYAYNCTGCGYWESNRSYSTTCP